LHILGQNNDFPPSTRKKDTSEDIRARDEQHENPSKYALEFLNNQLLQYSLEDRETASKMDAGFNESMADIYLEMNDEEDLDMEDKDKAFNKLYQSILTLPEFRVIKSRLVAIILAKFFVENYHYLPTPSIPLIECREKIKYIPISLSQLKCVSMRANGMSKARKDSSRLSKNDRQLRFKPNANTSNHLKDLPVSKNDNLTRTKPNPATSNNLKGLPAPTLLTSPVSHKDDGTIPTSESTTQNLTLVGTHNVAEVNASCSLLKELLGKPIKKKVRFNLD
jgi:hypothetical protein